MKKQNYKHMIILFILILLFASNIESKKTKKKNSNGRHAHQKLMGDQISRTSTCRIVKGIQICSSLQQDQSSQTGIQSIVIMIIGALSVGYAIFKFLNKNQKYLQNQFSKNLEKNPSTMAQDEKQQVVARILQANFSINATNMNQSRKFTIKILNAQLKRQHNSLFKLKFMAKDDNKSQFEMNGSLIFYKKKFAIMLVRQGNNKSKEGSWIFKGYGHKITKVNGDWYRFGLQNSQQNKGAWTIN